MQSKETKRKCVVVGSKAVGQTTLIASLTNKPIPIYSKWLDGPPSIIVKKTDTEMVNVEFWDTPYWEDYERLRPVTYVGADIFFIVFSLVDRRSFENVMSEWCPEIRRFIPRTPIILVGNKLDLRNEETTDAISFEEGQSMASQIKASAYLECTTTKCTKESLDELICLASCFTVEKPIKNQKCAIL